MATQTHYFKGKAQWAKVYKPDEKYGKFSIDLGMSQEDAAKFREIGLKNTFKERDNLYWITLRRDPEKMVWKNQEQVKAGPPEIKDADGHPFSELIGNGSEVTVKFVTYDYNNSNGKGKGSRLESVRVDKLVEYKKDGEATKEGFDLGFNF